VSWGYGGDGEICRVEVVGGFDSKMHCIGGREYSCLKLWTSVQTCRAAV